MTVEATPQREARDTTRELLALAAATVVVFGVAFIAFRNRQIWLDEAFTWYVAKQPFGQWWHFTFSPKGELNMALYYVLLRFLTPSSGTAFWMRLPSVISMVAAVPLVWILARRVQSGRFVRCAAAALFLASPYILYFAFDARAYAVLTLVTVGASVLLVLALEGSRPAAIAYVLVLPLGMALDLLTAFVIVAHVLALLLTTPGSFWTRAWATLRLTWLGLLVTAGAAVIAFRQRELLGRAPISITNLAHDAYNLTGHAGPLSVLLIIAIAWGAYALLVERPVRTSAVIVLLTATVPLVGALGLATIRPDISISYQLNTIPMLCIVAAAGLKWGLPSRPLRLGGLAVCVLLGLGGELYFFHSPDIEQPQTAARYLEAHARPGDDVTYLPPLSDIAVARYLQADGAKIPRPVGASQDASRVTTMKGTQPLSQAVAQLGSDSSLWVVVRSTSDLHQVPVAPTMHALGLHQTGSVSYDGYTVQRWQKDG